MRIAKPKIPLRSVVDTMHQGITTLALRISSAICEWLGPLGMEVGEEGILHEQHSQYLRVD